MAQGEPNDWVEVKKSEPDDWVEVKPPATTAKDKINQRVGPPSAGDIAVLRDIDPMTSVGYAASEVPIAAPIMNRAIRAVSPDTADAMELAKARYEQENPKKAMALGMAAPFALPGGPAGRGAQMAYQGGVSVADTLLKGGGGGEAATGGALTAGATGILGAVGEKAAPYLRRGGSAMDEAGGKVADYLMNKARGRAADSVLSGQKALNRELGEAGRQNVGRSMIDAGLMDKKLGQGPLGLAERVSDASQAANDRITRMIDDLTAEGVNPSKTQVLNRLHELSASTERGNPDTDAFHRYIDAQIAHIDSIPEERFTLRMIQDKKNVVPYDRNSDTVLQGARNSYQRGLQGVQDDVIGATGRGSEYKGLQRDSSGLINASRGADERVARSEANRNMSVTDYAVGAAKLASGATPAAAVASAGVNRYLRTRGSSAAAANLVTISKMMRTKFGPMLEAAAQRGKGAIGVTHALLYQKNPEYRMLYDQEENQ